MAHANEINNKKYYWLKLDRHFFGNARIKKLRKLAGGDTYTIIYLKLLLLSIEFDGVLVYEGIEESFEKEMALKLEEDDENVMITINYLKMQGLLIEQGEDCFLPEAKSSIGSETKSNVYKRNRNLMVGKIPTKFQPNSNQIPTEKDIEKDTTNILNTINTLNTINKNIINNNNKNSIYKEKNVLKREKFKPPTVEEVQTYCLERHNAVDAERFVDFYEAKGWMIGKNAMKDWKAAVRTWERKDKEAHRGEENGEDEDDIDYSVYNVKR